MATHEPNPFVEGSHRSATAVALDRWSVAEKWRRAVDDVVAANGLTFRAWLVLAATDALTRKPGSAAAQSEIACRTGLGEMAVSRATGALVDAGLVDRHISSVGNAYRVVLSAKGRRALHKSLEALAKLGT